MKLKLLTKDDILINLMNLILVNKINLDKWIFEFEGSSVCSSWLSLSFDYEHQCFSVIRNQKTELVNYIILDENSIDFISQGK